MDLKEKIIVPNEKKPKIISFTKTVTPIYLMSTKAYRGNLQPVSPRVAHDIRNKPTPGPGTYEIKSTISTKEVMSPRRTEVIE